VGIRRFASALLAVALGAAALATAGGSAAAARKPVKIKLLWLVETKGESVNAVPYYDDGAKLAAQQLGPNKVAYSRIPAPLVPAQAQTALLQAIDQHPDAIVGLPAASQVIPLSPTIAQSGIPFFALTSATQILKNGEAGAPNLYSVRPLANDTAIAVANYVTKTLKAKRIGMLCVQNALGTDSCNAVRKPIADAGASIVAERTNSTTATDLTDAVLAMKQANVDVVLDFNFPNPLGVFANQLIQNGVDVPHIATSSAGVEANAKVVTGQALANLRGVDECAPESDPSPAAKKFVKDYMTAYGYAPLYSSVESYDMVKFLYAAAQKAGSTDPAKLLKAVNSMSYKGICATYHPDAGNLLVHTAGLMKWDASGLEKVAVKLTFPPVGSVASGAATTTTGVSASSSTSTTAKP